MDIKEIIIVPNENSIDPELILDIKFSFNKLNEIPIHINGALFTKIDEKKIANFNLWTSEGELEFGAFNLMKTNEQVDLNIKIPVSLSQKSLDFLQEIRSRNSLGNIELNAKFMVQMLYSNLDISYLKSVKPRILGIQTGEKLRDAKIPIYQYDRDFEFDQDNLWILSSREKLAVFKFRKVEIPKLITIISSDWVQIYCPTFGIGDYLIYELPILELPKIEGELKEKINRTIKTLKKMKNHLVKAEWREVIESSRHFWELIRSEENIKEILIESGYNDEVYEDFNNIIGNFFDYSSKFHHELKKRSDELLEKFTISKEEAYLIYTVALNMLNLVLRKLNYNKI